MDMFCISTRYPGCTGGEGGGTIGKIFVLVYFMFHGIWIILGCIYFLVELNHFCGMGRRGGYPFPPWKIPPILLIFVFNPSHMDRVFIYVYYVLLASSD